MNIPIIAPQAVTFLTTFGCTAACENCCFQCNPRFKKRMTLAEMERYLDLLLNGNMIEKNSKLKEKVLINLIVTKDNLIHIKNYNQNIIKFKSSPIPILIANY
jgi:hypothetical protein